jgi:tetratricopeptide (TPR) repeat protein
MKGIWTTKWSWVVVGLAAFAIGFGLFRMLRTSGRERRIAEYVVAFPVPTSAMPEDGALNWIEGVMAYQRADYETARSAWEKSLALGEQAPFLLYFYIGQCDMALEDFNAARAAFAQVLDTRNDIHPLARWYLALASLSLDDDEAARPHLQILVEEGRYHAQDAADLLAGM